MHFWQNDRGLLRATAVTRGEMRVSTDFFDFLKSYFIICLLFIPNARCSGTFMETDRQTDRQRQRERETEFAFVYI